MMLKALTVFSFLHSGSCCQKDIHIQIRVCLCDSSHGTARKMLHFEQLALFVVSVALLKYSRHISTCCTQHSDYALLF